MTRLIRLHDRAVVLAQQTVALIALGLAAPSAALAGLGSLAYAEAVAVLAFPLAFAELAIGLVTVGALRREADKRILVGDHLGSAHGDEARIVLARARQITSPRYRRALARSLRSDLREIQRWYLRTARSARQVELLLPHADQVETIARALEQAGPVDAWAVVMVERLMTDPASPLIAEGVGRVTDALADIERRLQAPPQAVTAEPEPAHRRTWMLDRADPELDRAYAFHLAHQELTSAIPCFCGCDQTLGHRCLRDCYLRTSEEGRVEVDPGAGHCPICRGITNAVIAMHDAGLTAPDIRAAIEGRYADRRLATPPPRPPVAPAC